LGVVNQIDTRFQEVHKEVEVLNNKANTNLEQREFQVKFIDDDATIRDKDLVMAEVRHFLHSLIITDDVNTYQTGSHLRHILRAHTWKNDMQRVIEEVGRCVAGNGPKTLEMLRGLELMAKFLDEDFEGHVEALGLPSS